MKPKIAIIVKTTPERRSLLWLINSVENNLKSINYRFYIGDEYSSADWKLKLYDELRDKGHFIKVWEVKTAVTIARNYLVSKIQDEQYVMRVDDDFELGGEFKLDKMLKVLEDTSIDFVTDTERQIGEGKNKTSGAIRIESGLISFVENQPPKIDMRSDFHWKYKLVDGVRYAKADYMRNLILLKKHCLDKVKWNEKLEFSGEHVDFYLSLKKAGLQGAFTPDSIHLHRDDLKKSDIDEEVENEWRFKQMNENKKDVFLNEWGGIPIKKKSLANRANEKFARAISNICNKTLKP